MKSTVFVRPNLKVFVFGAILLLLVQHLITNVHSQATQSRLLIVNAREATNRDLQELIQRAAEAPNTELYLRISHCFEKKGDYRRALYFMRRAEQMSHLENSE
jgi:hypothetical protein